MTRTSLLEGFPKFVPFAAGVDVGFENGYASAGFNFRAGAKLLGSG